MNPRDYGLPYDDFRNGQVEALGWLSKDNWLYKRDSRNVKVVEAPTGTGKSGLILSLAAQNPDIRVLVLCATKLEQSQYEDNVTPDYKGFLSVKGRNNFHCHLDNPASDEECSSSTCFEIHVDNARCTVVGDDGKKYKCPIRNDCAYFQQLDSILESRVIVTNYAYGLAMLNFNPQRFGKFDLIVSDEGHILDSMLEQFIQVKLWNRQMDRLYQISLPTYETVPQWQRWCEDRTYLIHSGYKNSHDMPANEMSKDEISLAKSHESVRDSFKEIKNMKAKFDELFSK